MAPEGVALEEGEAACIRAEVSRICAPADPAMFYLSKQ
jgi:hypothetical protein